MAIMMPAKVSNAREMHIINETSSAIATANAKRGRWENGGRWGQRGG
jgi:hypothetical protein